jgi:hypothetical protein
VLVLLESLPPESLLELESPPLELPLSPLSPPPPQAHAMAGTATSAPASVAMIFVRVMA